MRPVAKFVVIRGHKWMTDLMQKTDLFESFKVVAIMDVLKVEFNEGEIVDLERAGRLIPSIIEGIEKSGDFPVFVHLDYILTEEALYHNINLKIPYYRNENVKVISGGKNWYMLDECIEKITGTKPTQPHNENSSKENLSETSFKKGRTKKPYKRS